MFNKLFAICLLVDDFEKSLSFYKDTLGLEVNSKEGKFADFKLEGPKTTEWGQTVAYFKDPDGNIWEISKK